MTKKYRLPEGVLKEDFINRFIDKFFDALQGDIATAGAKSIAKKAKKDDPELAKKLEKMIKNKEDIYSYLDKRVNG